MRVTAIVGGMEEKEEERAGARPTKGLAQGEERRTRQVRGEEGLV